MIPVNPGPSRVASPIGSRQPLQLRAAAVHGQGEPERALPTPRRAGLGPTAADGSGCAGSHSPSSWKRFRSPQLASSRLRNRPPKPTMLRADVPRSFWLDVGPGEERDGPLPPLYGWLQARWLARGNGDARGRSRNRRWLWRGHRVSMCFGPGRTQKGPASSRVPGYHGRQAVRLNGGWGKHLR